MIERADLSRQESILLFEPIILVEQKRDQGFPWRALLRKERVKSNFIEIRCVLWFAMNGECLVVACSDQKLESTNPHQLGGPLSPRRRASSRCHL